MNCVYNCFLSGVDRFKGSSLTSSKESSSDFAVKLNVVVSDEDVDGESWKTAKPGS